MSINKELDAALAFLPLLTEMYPVVDELKVALEPYGKILVEVLSAVSEEIDKLSITSVERRMKGFRDAGLSQEQAFALILQQAVANRTALSTLSANSGKTQ